MPSGIFRALAYSGGWPMRSPTEDWRKEAARSGVYSCLPPCRVASTCLRVLTALLQAAGSAGPMPSRFQEMLSSLVHPLVEVVVTSALSRGLLHTPAFHKPSSPFAHQFPSVVLFNEPPVISFSFRNQTETGGIIFPLLCFQSFHVIFVFCIHFNTL